MNALVERFVFPRQVQEDRQQQIRLLSEQSPYRRRRRKLTIAGRRHE